jgi:hypothetical protein
MTTVLDVAIGITFLYLLLALVVTTAQELIAALFELRAQNLYSTLAGMLEASGPAAEAKALEGSASLLVELYAHPLIRNLCHPTFFRPDRFKLPSYIPSKTFAQALLDVLRRRSTLSNELGADKLLAGARESVRLMQGHADLKRTLELVFEEAESKATRVDEQVALVTAGIETRFNERMSRASGWYKRKAQWIGLLLAFGVTLLTNSDSIHVASSLWKNGALRDAVVASAQSYDESATAPPASSVALPAPAVSSATAALETAVQTLASAKLPIGWDVEPSQTAWPLRILGWIITTLAVSLGAGFWFDALGKTLGLRKTGPRISPQTGRLEDDA